MHAGYCGITQNAYLPTMPEDVLPHIKAALQSHEDVEGKFYGTLYLILISYLCLAHRMSKWTSILCGKCKQMNMDMYFLKAKFNLL